MGKLVYLHHLQTRSLLLFKPYSQRETQYELASKVKWTYDQNKHLANLFSSMGSHFQLVPWRHILQFSLLSLLNALYGTSSNYNPPLW